MQPDNSVTNYYVAEDTISMSSDDRQDEEDSSANREAAGLLNKMDNAGYEREYKSTVEMGAMTPSSNGNGIPTCNEMCISLHKQHQKSLQEYKKSAEPPPPESPWHRLKTIFLVSIIAILIIWIIVYTILSQLDIV